MKKNKYDIFTENGLKKLFYDSAQELAEEVLWEIENAYENAIDMFYADYDPLWYYRTYSSYYGSSGSQDLFSSENYNFANDIYNVGINVDSSYIPGEPYKAHRRKNGADKDWVFRRTFLQGIHGINARQMFGKKKDKEYRRGLGKLKHTTYQVSLKPRMIRGKWVAKKNVTMGKYYNGVGVRVMNNMQPTPKGVINREFKQLSRKRVLRQMLDNIINSKIS